MNKNKDGFMRVHDDKMFSKRHIHTVVRKEMEKKQPQKNLSRLDDGINRLGVDSKSLL